jgi:hypothetical protein
MSVTMAEDHRMNVRKGSFSEVHLDNRQVTA